MRKSFLPGLAAFTCLTAISTACSHSSQILVSSLSPQGEYRVEVSQEKGRFERFVYLNAYRDGQTFVRNKLLYTGDHFDEEFSDLYPNYSWVSDSILKIGKSVAEPQPNKVTIKNETPNQISYLLIETYQDKYVLFDVAPEAAINLKFQFIGQFSCQGRFAASNKLFGSAVRLINDAECEMLGDFSIRIQEGAPIIESPTLQLKKTPCCAVDRPDINHE
ncbi:MAG TPA: hypothetical protein VFY40_05200 [Blastocatellia bacterium]|nr:hypothetical protein [Blastocatellia bacterium]